MEISVWNWCYWWRYCANCTWSPSAPRILLDNSLKWNSQSPRADDNYDVLSTGHLKQVPHILHWIMFHVLCLNHGGHSRLDQAVFHLIYILLHDYQDSKFFQHWGSKPSVHLSWISSRNLSAYSHQHGILLGCRERSLLFTYMRKS